MELNASLLMELMALSTGVFLGIHFLTSSYQFKPKQFLGWFMLIAFLPDLVIVFLENKSESTDFVWMLPNANLIYIPFLYFYVKGITGSFEKKWLLYLLPALVLYPFQVFGIVSDWDIFLFLEGLFSYCFNVFILVLILKRLQKHQKNIFNYFSSIEEKSLNWIRILAIIMIGFNLLWLVEDLVYSFSDIELFFPQISLIATFVTVYWIGFKSLRQPDFFIPVVSENTNKIESDLNESELQIFARLEELMCNEKIYTEPDLSLRGLADKLEATDKVLSKIINHQTQNNFYYYINSFRVKAFKASLEDGQNKELTLFGLAQTFGFKSKSTFYSVFKKMESLTPSEYLKKTQSI